MPSLSSQEVLWQAEYMIKDICMYIYCDFLLLADNNIPVMLCCTEDPS